MTLVADPTRIRESHTGAFREATSETGTRREIVIIEAGWGSSGYYSEEVLGRDIPRIYPVGTKMYLNHQTRRESMERPEGDLRYLIGKIVETPRMAGIAAVSVAEIYEHWVQFIDAMAEDIGLSIRALGMTEEGDAAGKHGPIVLSLTEGISIDYVTEAGAGGSIGQLVESRGREVVELFESAAKESKVAEALDSELRENLEKAGEEKFGSKEPYTYCYVEDIEIDQNWVVYRVRVSGEDATYYRMKFLRNTDGDVELQGEPVEVKRDVSWVTPSEDTGLGESLQIIEGESLEDFVKRVASHFSPVPSKESGDPSLKPTKEDGHMTDEERRALEEKVRRFEDENKTLTEERDSEKDGRGRAEDALRLNEAGQIAAKVVGEVEGLPRKAQVRAIEATLRGDLPVHSDGKLDSDALKERARSKAKDEKDYLGETSGGRVTGLGESLQPSSGGGTNGNGSDDAGETALDEALGRLGMPEKARAHAVEGR